MKKLFIAIVFLLTVIFSYTVIAQELGSLSRDYEPTFPERIENPTPEPLHAGTYTIGYGGHFPNIQSAFDKLGADGVDGEVILELINTTYVAASGQYGFLLKGPIPGAGPECTVTIKPAENKNVTILGNREALIIFSNTSYLTLDGVGLTGATTLTVHALKNTDFASNDCINFWNNSDHNVVQNITFISEDITRRGTSIMIWNYTNSTGTPDSNLIQNNFIKESGIGIFILGYGIASTSPNGNIIRGNIIGSETDSLIAWGIQTELALNTVIENNVVQNVRYYNGYFNVGINAYSGYGNIIRNNVVHNIYASGGIYGTSGILLSGFGSNNWIYNNIVYDIRSSATYGEATVAGIQMWSQYHPKVYYNSVYLKGKGNGANPDGSGALYIYSGCTNVEAKNNVLINTRDESPYCASSIYIYGYSTMLNSDHNDLYYEQNQNNCLVRSTGGDYFTLAEWQATGRDVNSISEMPNFIDHLLHIKTSRINKLDGGGIPITDITTDFDGELRDELKPDIGADEFILSWDTLYIPTDYSTIQAGIDAAGDGDWIIVEDGTYYENINYNGKAITIASNFLLDGNKEHIENTIINGSQSSNPDTASVVTFESGEDTTSVLCGFTITGGTGTYSWEYADKAGGGIYIDSSGAKIIHNYIVNNSVEFDGNSWGGGILAFSVGNHNLIVEENIISNNSINGTNWAIGGGIVLWNDGNATASIKKNTILENSVIGFSASGGGIDCRGPINEVYIGSNLIRGNSVQTVTSYGGGGIDICKCVPNTPTICNNLIVANYSNRDGGGILVDVYGNDSPIIRRNGEVISSFYDNQENLNIFINNTIIDNEAVGFGGGICATASLNEIINCILWGNTAQVGNQVWGGVHVNYSDIEGGYPGVENIDHNPEFRDILNGDYRLSTNSPCIGAGIESIEISGTLYCCPPLCYGGNPRPNPAGSIPDIGACESYLPNPLVGVKDDLSQIPEEYSLSQNYPNPFNPTTTIKYGLKERSFVELKVYDILGTEVASLIKEEQEASYYELIFNAAELSSGVYLYQLKAGGFIETKKMLLIK